MNVLATSRKWIVFQDHIKIIIIDLLTTNSLKNIGLLIYYAIWLCILFDNIICMAIFLPQTAIILPIFFKHMDSISIFI